VSGRETVSMIGLGQMGSALARAIAASDLDLTVWNRSDAKSRAFADQGASVAPSIGDAVAASDVIVVCVRGYDVAIALFDDPGTADSLAGKTLVQLGNGVPTEVAESASWFTARGAAYLDGSIMSYPDTVGTDDCQILVSGDPPAFERCEPLFDSLGGDIRFLGADPTASAVINTSALAFLYVNAHAFVSAAAMCDASGAPLDVLAAVIGNFTTMMPTMFDEYVAMIGTGSYDSTTLRLASGADNLRAIAEFGRASGVDTGLFDAALRTFDVSAAEGHGTNLAAIFEAVKRQPRRPLG
jgi:3-hydroxyisobutyrate dehydrogenase-like beta-hydroxyacid dehydrogenase